MEKAFIVLIIMIYLHIFDDFHLQGILASMKQKQWWKDAWEKDNENSSYKKHEFSFYERDYIPALIAHSFSWAFTVTLPILWLLHRQGEVMGPYFLMLILNTIIHAYIDNEKANKHTINLVADQSYHMAQILLIWICFLGVIY
mgnify:CR=1 FL=1